jgi:hypothetical protein
MKQVFNKKNRLISKASCGTLFSTQHEAGVAGNPVPRSAKQGAGYAF